jgi:hypothetical protein
MRRIPQCSRCAVGGGKLKDPSQSWSSELKLARLSTIKHVARMPNPCKAGAATLFPGHADTQLALYRARSLVERRRLACVIVLSFEFSDQT